ncbi:MAG: RNA polymerase sigma factor [Lachnospiraceae bacterium]|nr:RNA polymerase sigma factor [Lachnospiraceae bacterium]
MKNYQGMNDETLVRISLLGEDKAYEELVKRHGKAVLGTAQKITHNRYSAEDASQDAFVSAWMKLGMLRDHSKFRSWVCMIAKNCARSIVTDYCCKVPSVSLHLVENMELSDNPDPEWLALTETEDRSELNAMVDALSEKLRETLRLHYFEGLSVAEIAEKLSVPVGTVKWRLSEGRNQLRKGYGIMDKTYQENESIEKRVMRQIEALKLWALRRDKSGFEEAFQKVLAAVEELQESKEKQYMLADVLCRGMWWIPGRDNEETKERVRQAALAGHNDDIMQEVVAAEQENVYGEDLIRLIRDEQIPKMESLGFTKTLGYLWFWLGYDYRKNGQTDLAYEAFEKVTEILNPSEEVYYANALAAIECEKKMQELRAAGNRHVGIGACGEEYRKVNGKWYFWAEPGYNAGDVINDQITPPFINLAGCFMGCDSLIDDPGMRPGERKISSDDRVTLDLLKASGPVVTPAGTFEDCLIFRNRINGDTKDWEYESVETAVKPGVGIVAQTFYPCGAVLELTSFEGPSADAMRAGTLTENPEGGRFAFVTGNRWEYRVRRMNAEEAIADEEYRLEVIYADEKQADLSVGYVMSLNFTVGKPETTWLRNMLAAVNLSSAAEQGSEEFRPVDVSVYLDTAEKLAKTRREKVHTAIFREVMKNIYATDPVYTPECREIGRLNRFDMYAVTHSADGWQMDMGDERFAVQWLKWGEGFGGLAVVCHWIYDTLNNHAGFLWNDAWVPGFSEKRKYDWFGSELTSNVRVTDEEIVVTPAGTFERCRHLITDVVGGSHFEYWFAEGVGIVKFLRTVTERGEPRDAEWFLTKYEGTCEGYFSLADGFFRRYEPMELEDGYRGMLELTCEEDEKGIVLFKNFTATQDRDAIAK